MKHDQERRAAERKDKGKEIYYQGRAASALLRGITIGRRISGTDTISPHTK